jgi:hypothetical protein
LWIFPDIKAKGGSKMLYGWQAVIITIVMICIFVPIPLAFCLIAFYKPKKTYLIDWYVDGLPKFLYGTDIVRARSIDKAWKKVQKKHYLPISLIQFKEIG